MTALKGLFALLVLLIAWKLLATTIVHGQAERPRPGHEVVYMGQIKDQNLYLDAGTGQLWLLDVDQIGKRAQANWIAMGKFQGLGKPFVKE